MACNRDIFTFYLYLLLRPKKERKKEIKKGGAWHVAGIRGMSQEYPKW
jgi:hypothetical protein